MQPFGVITVRSLGNFAVTPTLVGILTAFSLQLHHRAFCQEDRVGLLNGQTLGGPFHWTDELIYRDWRIQRHAIVGHTRLIDPENRRQAVGTYSACIEKFQSIKPQLTPLPKHVVLVLHGLGASREFMEPMADYLREEGKYCVINFGYASTLQNVDDSAQSLRHVLENLDGVESIDFVAHSLGNIVIRRCLFDWSRAPNAKSKTLGFNRMVMISPPNHGAEMAGKVQQQAMLKTASAILLGKAVEELDPGRGWPALEKQLEIPKFPFGIIVGGTGDERGYLELIDGDDDGLLSIETQKLKESQELVQVTGIHQLLPRDKEVQKKTLNFLRAGKFEQ